MVIDVLIVDDHGIIRDGVRRLLESHVDITVLATAANAAAGIEAAVRHRPQVVVMDISMPGMNGIEATRAIVSRVPGAGVLMLSVHSSSELIRQAIEAGARGYLLKESVGDELVRAVRAVAAGRRYFREGVAKENINGAQGDAAGIRPLGTLTPREREVLRLVAEGKTNAEAAATLHLSLRTVETYRYRLMQKLDLPDIASLIRFAIREGIISVD